MITGRTLVSLENGDLATINNETGDIEIIGLGLVLSDIAVSSSNRLFGVTSSKDLYEIDLQDGSFSQIGNLRTGNVVVDALGFDGTGQLYGAGDSAFYRVNTSTGQATLVAQDSSYQSSGDIIFDPANNWFWGTSQGNGTDVLYRISLDGTFTPVGDIGFQEVYGITLDSQGELLGYTSSREQIVIDTATGAGIVDRSLSSLNSDIFGATEYNLSVTPTDFIGSEIQLEIDSPNQGTPLIEPVTATVDDSVEFMSPYSAAAGASVVPHQFDISSSSIRYQIDPSTSSSQFGSGSFNGYIFTDISDTLPAITNVSIDESETTLNLDESDVTFNSDQIFINVGRIILASRTSTRIRCTNPSTLND